MVPKYVFFTKGTGVNRDYLHSFELALKKAKIEKYNLVCVSSILPPNCKLISIKEGLGKLNSGQIVNCVMAKNSTNELSRLISSSIGVAIPRDKGIYGYISEHHAYGETAEMSGQYAEYLAASMLASSLGAEFNSYEIFGRRKEDKKRMVFNGIRFLIGNKIVETKNITEIAVCKERGIWTTVISAAVFII